jgi:hypothetical protein
MDDALERCASELTFRRHWRTSDLRRLILPSFLENLGCRQMSAVGRAKGFTPPTPPSA